MAAPKYLDIMLPVPLDMPMQGWDLVRTQEGYLRQTEQNPGISTGRSLLFSKVVIFIFIFLLLLDADQASNGDHGEWHT